MIMIIMIIMMIIMILIAAEVPLQARSHERHAPTPRAVPHAAADFARGDFPSDGDQPCPDPLPLPSARPRHSHGGAEAASGPLSPPSVC